MKNIIIFFLFFTISISIYCQKEYVINSSYLMAQDTVWVFVPSDYEDGEVLPLTYLLHGWSGKYWHWDYMIDCQKYADRYNTIIVCPDGLYDSWYLNSPVVTENQYESFFTEDLIPLLEDNYNINHDSIFITGLSMGGHGALYLFSKMPGYFTKAGSLSGLLDLRGWERHYGISRVLGLTKNKEKSKVLFNYSVISSIDTLMYVKKPVIISCGTEDPFYKLNMEFVDYCNSKNIAIELLESSGGHNADYWRSNIVDHFEFFFR